MVVRLGVVGLGGIGQFYAKLLREGKAGRCALAAIASGDPEKRAKFEGIAKTFADCREMIGSGTLDAVLIATPHPSHVPIGIEALAAGLHVLVEKPIAVHKAEAERLIAARKIPGQVFAAMFQFRTHPLYMKIKQMIDGGELGELRRINWIVTDWFRSELYYSSGGWRATWRGEGGGTLLNQCPHNLDLLQWLTGMPARVRGFCNLGKYHNIEVEDEVTAYFEYPNGATGVFITSTGEAPGTNRLEITGELGKIVAEGGRLTFARNAVETSRFSRETSERFGAPAVSVEEIAVEAGAGTAHTGILSNFADAILDGTPLIAPAEEGIRSLELANAMLYSSMKNTTVELPLDGVAYAEMLKDLIETSRFEKKVVEAAEGDMEKSFK